MIRKTGLRVIASATIVLLVVACKGDRQPVVRHTLHEYGTTSSAVPTAASNLPLLALENFTADAAIDTRLFVYRRSDQAGGLHTYDGTHSWTSVPHVMMKQRAKEICGRRLGGRVRISDYPAEKSPLMRVRARLLRFDEVRAAGTDQGEAVVAIDYEVLVWRQGSDESPAGWERYGPARVRSSATVDHDPDQKVWGCDGESYARAMRAAADQALGSICDVLAARLDELSREPAGTRE